MLRIALKRIERWYRKATGRKGGKSGTVTAVQRFGSALNLNLHFHVVSIDEVFDRGADDALHFFQGTPSTEDFERLVEDIASAAEAWLAKQGHAGEDNDNTEDDDDAGTCQRFETLR